jgi:hypothetical protein
MHKRTLMGLAIALLSAVVLLACGESSAATSVISGGKSTTGSTTTGTTHYKVGQQVKVGSDYIVTVNGVTTSQGDDFTKPKSGNTFLVVDVTLKNTSGKSQDVSSLISFDLKDSTGQKYTATFLSGVTGPDGAVAAGEQVRGQIPFEVPSSQHKYVFSFQPDIISSDVVLWDLSI